MKEPAYKDITPEELAKMARANKEALDRNNMLMQGAHPTTGPEKLDPKLVEFMKAIEDEMGRLRKRILELEIFAGPFQQLFAKMFNEEIDKKLGRHGGARFADVALACEATPMQQFKYKYNV